MRAASLKVYVRQKVEWLSEVSARLQELSQSFELFFDRQDFDDALSSEVIPIIVSGELPDPQELHDLQKLSLQTGGLIWITHPERMSDDLIQQYISLKVEIWSNSWSLDFFRYKVFQWQSSREAQFREAEEKDQLLEILSLQRALNVEWQKLSLVDELTGAPNRRAFEEQFQKDWAVAKREGGDLSVIIIDIDHFKVFNDEFGHQRGDEILQLVAEKCRACVRRPGDLFARLGGEEFIALLPRTSAVGALVVAEAMRSVVGEAKIKQGQGASADFLSLSAGIASLSQGARMAESPDQLIRAADEALYRAKQVGRNSSFLWAHQPSFNVLSRPGLSNSEF